MEKALSFLRNRQIKIDGTSPIEAVVNWGKGIDGFLHAAKFKIIFPKGFPIAVYESLENRTRVIFDEKNIFVIDLTGDASHQQKLMKEAETAGIPIVKDFIGSFFIDELDEGTMIAVD